jgi:hypothetical protein
MKTACRTLDPIGTSPVFRKHPIILGPFHSLATAPSLDCVQAASSTEKLLVPRRYISIIGHTIWLHGFSEILAHWTDRSRTASLPRPMIPWHSRHSNNTADCAQQLYPFT